jgi:outer membrane cobalamin receptor
MHRSFHKKSRLQAAVSSVVVLALYCSTAAAQQTATSGRTITADIEEVLVTGRSLETTLPLQLSKYGADLEIVTAAQIQNHGFIDVGQSLEMLVPGLHLTTQAGAFSYVNLQMQGSRQSDTLWTIDGIRINNRLYNSTSPADTLASSMIERVEVLKGPHSLMYGTQAIAGVANVVTRSFTDKFDAGFNVGTGSYGLKRASVYGSGSAAGHKFVAWASKDENDGYRIYDDYQPTSIYRDRGYNVENFGVKYGYDLTDELSFAMSAIHTEAALDYPNITTTSVNDRNEDLIYARLDYQPAEHTQFFLKGYSHDWDTNYYPAGQPSSMGDYWGYKDEGMTAGALLTPIDTLEVHLGYDYQTYNGRDDSLLIAGQQESVHAVYAQLRSTNAFSDSLHIAAGTRYNKTEGVDSTDWSLMGLYDISDYLYVQGVLATAFMLPSAENLYRIHCPSGMNCTHGNPNLKPEQALGLTMSLGGRLDVVQRPLSWQVSAWDRKVDNLITSALIPAELIGQFPPEFTRTFINVPTEVDVKGAEFLLRGPITTGLTFELSYTYSKEVGAGTSYQLRDRPKNQYKGSLAYVSQRYPFGINAAFKYIGQKTADMTNVNLGIQEYGDAHVFELAGHVYLDGRDGHHRVTARVENVLDEEYATTMGNAIRTGTTPQERFIWNRLGPPRTFSVNYSYSF